MSAITFSPLGKKTKYISTYQRDLLFAIPRKLKRQEIGVSDSLPFKGVDIWNGYELSWLNEKGKPVVAFGQFIFACESPNLIESKSFKLYLNSFNNTQFESMNKVRDIIQNDLADSTGSAVEVRLMEVRSSENNLFDCEQPSATQQLIHLDKLDVSCDTYSLDPRFLQTEDREVSETVFSDLLKSNCLITGQPDWASVFIAYQGRQINHAGLLKYIVSYRNHHDFHEHCVERIFVDILKYCQPQQLTVKACYTRRGGLDINPYRSTQDDTGEYVRMLRQ